LHHEIGKKIKGDSNAKKKENRWEPKETKARTFELMRKERGLPSSG